MPGSKRQLPLYTLSVASQLSGVSTHSIRQYIDKGVIIPFKTESARHLFSDVDVIRLKSIKNDIQVHGLNMAGIKRAMAQTPCWLIKGCTKEEQNNCDAFKSYDQPCWAVEKKSGDCQDLNCHDCDVYGVVDRFDHLKDMFKTMAKIEFHQS
ncbi:MAG: MerR family transcriptional regulator [Candidatus Marinimicrobia bacterium]|nr:MerR family transcriptional regulator [FCB group bacterium]MBL7024871.1 MerR family transcriptional regulator [Candidatus Neomarinimicrobiota bacterium]